MRCSYALKKWSSAKLSLNRDLSLNKLSLNRDCTVYQKWKESFANLFECVETPKDNIHKSLKIGVHTPNLVLIQIVLFETNFDKLPMFNLQVDSLRLEAKLLKLPNDWGRQTRLAGLRNGQGQKMGSTIWRTDQADKS